MNTTDRHEVHHSDDAGPSPIHWTTPAAEHRKPQTVYTNGNHARYTIKVQRNAYLSISGDKLHHIGCTYRIRVEDKAGELIGYGHTGEVLALVRIVEDQVGEATGRTLYRDLKTAGVELDKHESDLYALDTPDARRIIAQHGHELQPFQSNADRRQWLELPFQYDPFWDKVEERSRRKA